MRSFNGDFPPWRCSGGQRRRGERRRHPLGNKPWKKELHHQDEPWIRSLERMLQCQAPKKRFARYDVNTGKAIGGGLPPIGVIIGLLAGVGAVGALLVYGLQ